MLAWTVYLGTFIHFQIGFRRLEIAISVVSTVPFSTDRRRMPWSRIPRNSPGLSCQAGEWQCHGTKDVAMALATGGLCILCWVWSDTDRRFSKTVLNSVSFMVISPKIWLRQPYVQLNPGRMWLKPSTRPVANWTGQRGQCLSAQILDEFCVASHERLHLVICTFVIYTYTILLWAKSLRVKRLCYIPAASQRSSWHGLLRELGCCL